MGYEVGANAGTKSLPLISRPFVQKEVHCIDVTVLT